MKISNIRNSTITEAILVIFLAKGLKIKYTNKFTKVWKIFATH